MTSKNIHTIVLGLVTVAFFAVTGHAQLITGAVTGSVSDTSGAIVPGADIQLVNVDTSDTRTAVSNELGNFTFLQLPLGTYRLEASLGGFKTFRRAGIIVETGRSLAVPVRLEVGDVTETVEVVAGTPLLDTVTSSLGSVMEERNIATLPLLGRNPMGLANLIPTVRGIGEFGGSVRSTWGGAAVAIGGGDPLANSALIDGLANDKPRNQGAMIIPTVEGTREFRIVTNAMSAEFGRTAGGILSVITKSGTNEFHGSLFEYLRHDKLNANEFFANKSGQPRPTLRWNQFGGSLGGPVLKNRLFFFATYEGYAERRQGQRTLTSPTALERGGNFSDTRASNGNLIAIHDPLTTGPDAQNPGRYTREQFPNNVIPEARLNPVSRAVLGYYPVPNLPGLPFTRAANYFAAVAQPIDKDSINVRLDTNLSAARTLAVRYIYENIDWVFPNFFRTIADDDGRTIFIPRHNAFLHYTDALSATFLIDAKIGLIYENEYWTVPGAGFDITSLGLPARFDAERQKREDDGFPNFNITDASAFGRPAPAGNPTTTGTASVAVTKVYEKHNVKFGYEHRLYQRNDWGPSDPSGNYSFNRGFTQGPNPLQSSATAGYGVASFMLGFPSSGAAGWRTDATRTMHYDALFVQDDWKVTPKLTLNLGLRWEHEGALTDRFDVLSNFNPNIASPLQVPGLALRGGLIFPNVDGTSRGLTAPSSRDFGPRFGFAYQVSDKMVVRGGYGIMHIPTTGDGTATGFDISTPMVTTIDGGLTPFNNMSDPFPDGILRATGSSLGALTGIGGGVSGQLRDVQRGYSQQWNVTLQYEPWSNWLFEGAWVANKGTHLTRSQTLNFLSEQNMALGNTLVQSVPNPFFGIINTGPLSNETVTRQQLLLPYPQFTSVSGGTAYWGNSMYHALALKVERRFARNYSILMAYTASKWIDDGRVGSRPGSTAGTGVQNWNNLRGERSISFEDVPQRLVLANMWVLPSFDGRHSFVRHTLGGWQMNAITTLESGRPISLTATVAGGGNRPNAVPGVSARVDNPTLERWFNTDAFSLPVPYTFGNVSRTLPDVRSDGLFNVDFSLFKTFPITEKYKLQFRAEAFNLTNTTTFDTPGRAAGSGTFGIVTATARSQLQSQPVAREFQFALRLEF